MVDESVLKFIMSRGFISSLILIAACFVVWIIARRQISKYIKKTEDKEGRVNGSARLVRTCIKVLIILVAVLGFCTMNGIDVGSIVATLGIAGVVVGFALQDIIKDILKGARIVNDHFFEVGDVIKYKDYEGVVIEFNLKSTKISDIYNGSVISICNRNFEDVKVYSHVWCMDVDLSYEDDFNKIHKVMERIAEKAAGIELMEKATYAGTQEFCDSSIKYRLLFESMPQDRPFLWRSVIRIVQEELGKEGITIPYQQIDVHNADTVMGGVK